MAETDKSTKTPWHLRFAGAILRKIGYARTACGADKDGLLAKTVKGIVSLVSKLSALPDAKDSFLQYVDDRNHT